jgi:AcrR family transcriptional regulator
MPRTVNRRAHAIRRDVFVDAAQRLIQAKGYEQMSIQDVLDEADASRGAFYHYFDSKASLLEAIVERMVDASCATLAPVAADPSLSAVQKLEGFFARLASRKAERRELVTALLQSWLLDGNAVVREKFRRNLVGRLAPLLATVVRQGQAEGVFTPASPISPASPDATARVLVSLIQGANDAAVDLYFARQANTIAFADVERQFFAYTRALERILGVRPGSLTIGDSATIQEWFG